MVFFRGALDERWKSLNLWSAAGMQIWHFLRPKTISAKLILSAGRFNAEWRRYRLIPQLVLLTASALRRRLYLHPARADWADWSSPGQMFLIKQQLGGTFPDTSTTLTHTLLVRLHHKPLGHLSLKWCEGLSLLLRKPHLLWLQLCQSKLRIEGRLGRQG